MTDRELLEGIIKDRGVAFMTEGDYDPLVTDLADAILSSGFIHKDAHCKDCCCARAWQALGVKEYDGLSIPEHIKKLKERIFELEGGFK